MRLFLAFFILSLGVMSCTRDVKPPVTFSQEMKEWNVDPNFSWSNLDLVQASIPNGMGTEGTVLRNEHGKVIKTIEVESDLWNLAFPPNEKIYFTNAAHQFGADKSQKSSFHSTHKSVVSGFCDDPNLEVDRIISTSNSDLDIKNETVLVTAGQSGTLTINDNAIIYLCANQDLEDLIIKGGGQSDVYIGEGIIINSTQKVSMHYPGDFLQNHGTLNCPGVEVGDGLWENYGTINSSSETYLNKKGLVVNNGTWYTTALKLSGSFENNAEVITSSSTVIWSTGTLINNCQFYSESSLSQSGLLKQNGFFHTNYFFNAYAGSITEAATGSHIFAKHFEWRGGLIKNTGSGSFLIEIQSIGKIFEGAEKEGLIDFCDLNGLDKDDAGIYDDMMHCETGISASSCNPRGYEYVPVDSDSDGVPDNEDPAPNDPNITGKSGYPLSGRSYVCFEDLWPYIGDYDFNDVVISVDAEYKKAGGLVTEIELEVIVEALGGSLPFDLAFRPLYRDDITGIAQYEAIENWYEGSSNGKYESTGSYINLIQDLPRWVSPYYNNTGDGPSRSPDTLRTTIFVNDLAESKVLVPELFLVSHEDSGIEIHLNNRPPSKMANPAIFGSGQDFSESPNWYTTSNGLPWGLEVLSSKGFYWTKGKERFTDAYPKFESWVNSGGKSNENWFLEPNSKFIFLP